MDSDNSSDDDDLEFDAEMHAVRAIKNERISTTNEVDGQNNISSSYNKAGLLHCLQNMDTTGLDFSETYQICQFPFDMDKDLDDLEREVLLLIIILSFIS